MVRTVKISLEADAARYIGPVKESESATEGLDRKVTALDRDINKIPADAAKAAASMKLLGEESKATAVKLDDVGKRSTSLGAIDQQIAKTRTEIRGLADEFNRTGNTSILTMLFGKQDDLKRLEGLKKDVAGALKDGATEGGKAGASSFTSSFSNAFSNNKLGQIAISSAITAGIAAAFLTASGPILAATGLTGIAAGIVGQLRDPSVHDAFAGMGHDLLDQLTSATTSFRDPLVQVASIFGDSLHKVISSIDFSSLSKLLVPLASGVGGLLTNMMPGFNRALESAQPVIQALAQELPKLGGAISDMFANFARSKDGAIIAIKLIMDGLRFLADAIGEVVHAGAKLTEWIVNGLDKFAHFMGKVPGKMGQPFRDLATALDNLKNTDTSGLDSFAGSADHTAGAVDALTRSVRNLSTAFDDYFGAQMGADQAATKFATDVYGLKAALDSHSKSIEANSAAGAANRQVVLQAIQDAKAHRDALIAQAGGVNASKEAIAAANATYDADIAKLRQMAVSAGIAASQFDSLAGTYNINLNVNLNKTAAQLNAIGDLQSRLGRAGAFAEGGIVEHAAAGLLSDAKVYSAVNPGRYMIAEPQTGGEGFVPRYGDYGRSTAIIDQEARWYGGRFVPGGGVGGGVVVNAPITVNAGMGTNGQEVARQIAGVLRPFIAATGGGNVQVALGRRGQ